MFGSLDNDNPSPCHTQNLGLETYINSGNWNKVLHTPEGGRIYIYLEAGLELFLLELFQVAILCQISWKQVSLNSFITLRQYAEEGQHTIKHETEQEEAILKKD